MNTLAVENVIYHRISIEILLLLNPTAKQTLALECLARITELFEHQFKNDTPKRLTLERKLDNALIEINYNMRNGAIHCLDRIYDIITSIGFKSLISFINDSDNIKDPIIRRAVQELRESPGCILEMIDNSDTSLYETVCKYKFIYYLVCMSCAYNQMPINETISMLPYRNSVVYNKSAEMPQHLYDCDGGKSWYIVKNIYEILNEDNSSIVEEDE